MPTSKAIAMLGAIIVVVGAYLALTLMLGIHDYWPGFLFLLQWSMMEAMKTARLAHSGLGAAGGLALASIPVWLTPVIGFAGANGAMLGLILACTFALIKGWLPMLCNSAMMLFLTVATIPHIAGHAPPGAMFLGLASGIVYFGGLALIAARVLARQPAGSPIAA